AHGRRPAAARPALGLAGQQARAAPRARALRTIRAGPPPAGRRLATETEEKWYGRDTGTRIFKAIEAASSAAELRPKPRALARRHPHRGNPLKGGRRRPEGPDFHPSRSPTAARASARFANHSARTTFPLRKVLATQ